MMFRIALFVCSLLCFSCQSTKSNQSAPKEVKTKLSAKDIPEKPKSPDISTDELECDTVEQIALLSCLYSEVEVPFPYCEQKDSYAILGVMPYAFCTNDVDIIVANLGYAKQHYKASTVGLMQRAIKKLKKDSSKSFTRPMVLTMGLSAKEAYEQMMSVYLEYQIRGEFSDPMKDLINDYASREPECLFFQFLRDLAKQDFSNSHRLAVQSKSNCSYYKIFNKNTAKIDVQYVQDLLRKKL